MFNFVRMFHDDPRGTFSISYKCFSVSLMPGHVRDDVNKGGKIILPPSALDRLTQLNIQYPMLFKLENKNSARVTHAGVLEFVADEGRAYLPYWMMNNLLLEEGDHLTIQNVSLPVALYAKFQAQSTDFLDITNQKAVLENALRNFACLTAGDMIAINYNDKVYELKVLETKPENAVSIIECDMNVDFAAPVGYEEPEGVSKVAEEEEGIDVSKYLDENKFQVFGGNGNRLDGKTRTDSDTKGPIKRTNFKRGIPNYKHKPNTLTFIRNLKTAPENTEDEDDSFKAFSGQGKCIKDTRK